MSKPIPLVSVSVVTYNHKDYIKQCLDGILMQETNFPFEIILGEDESNDGTREICIEYTNKYPDKIKLFLRSRKDVIYINGNPTGRYNFIQNLKAANGKYIALCEGDDYWTDPLKLQKQVDFLEENTDVNLCFHNADIIDTQGKFVKTLLGDDIINEEYTPQEVCSGKILPTASVVFRSILIELPRIMYSVQNADTVLFALLTQKSKAKYISSVNNSIYRFHDRGVWNSLDNLSKTNALANSYYKLEKVINKENKSFVAQVALKNYGTVFENLLPIKRMPFYVKDYFNFLIISIKYRDFKFLTASFKNLVKRIISRV